MLDVTKPSEVADLFVELCTRLRAIGATKVEALGMSASFALPDKAPLPEMPARREPEREPEEPLTPEGRELQARARRFAAGGAP